MNPTVTAFKASPDRGRGLARDMRVRWALEEVGQAYDVRLLSFAEMKEAPHRRLQPFGQIPTFEDGDVAMFDSGAIVLHIAETRGGLLPTDPAARARAMSWMFAAVSTIEPPIVDREIAWFNERDRPTYEQRLADIDGRIRARLADLSFALGECDWLDGAFSCGDLLMIDVLRRLGSSGLLADFPNLARYVARGEERAAFKRAFEAQYAVFLAASAE